MLFFAQNNVYLSYTVFDEVIDLSSNNNKVFNLIKGGLGETSSDSVKKFAGAAVTDTRLMGVVCMSVHWELPENSQMTDLYQFFYFDAEEDGFETYSAILGGNTPEDYQRVIKTENELVGGLGASQVSVTEKEARYILQSYVEFNRRNNIVLPSNYDEYSFMLNPAVTLSDAEKHLLMCKQSPSLDSPYQVINYFLMRCFAKDFEAAKFLTKGYVRTNLFPEHKAATLLKNVTEEYSDAVSGSNTNYRHTDEDGMFETFSTTKSYMCEALIEYDGKYYLIISQLSLEHLKIVKYEKVSVFKLSAAEASMMTRRSEYITVTDIIPYAPEFSQESTSLVSRAMVTDHEGGKLFMIFSPHNDHVKKPVFMLNDDVVGIYYVVDDSQLILASYSLEGIKALESDLQGSHMAEYIVPVSKYEFKDPVLFDFINSGFDDFEDFVELISSKPKK